MLERSDIPAFLVERGLMGRNAGVGRVVRVDDASRRNRVFIARVEAGTGTGYVVKQSLPADAQYLANEASVLRELSRAGAADFTPTQVLYDPSRHVLVTELVGDAEDLARHHAARGFSPLLARAAGRVLTRLHGVAPETVPSLPTAAGAPLGLPPDPPPLELVHALSGGGVELVRLVQSSDELCERLEQVRSDWRPESVVHGDVRWGNWIPAPAPGSRRRTRVTLVDWELAQRGDRCFDVGAMLAEYLFKWVTSITVADGRDLGRLPQFARHPLSEMRPAIRAFWDAYVRGGVGGAPSASRVMRFAAARVVQLAFEEAQEHARLYPVAGPLLQLSLGILRRPTETAVRLLGLPVLQPAS
jgi:aminoglycoside phosphotransferase (APT) family kinase protein